MQQLKSVLLFFLLGLFCLSFSWGCTTTGSTDDALETSTVEEQPFFARAYREIQIPPGFEFDQKHSVFVETKSFRGGILHFNGRREVNSVAEFFKNNMPKHQWDRQYIGTGVPMVQAYVKEHKTCMIKITETTMTTSIVIYVSDTSTEPAAENMGQ